MVEVFVGDTCYKYLQECCVGSFLNSLVTIVRPVGGDSRQGNRSQRQFHLIDLGLACRFGQVATELLLRYLSDADKESFMEWTVPSHKPEDVHGCDLSEVKDEESQPSWGHSKWLAPEVIPHWSVFIPGDMYSLGILVMEVASCCELTFLIRPLWKVAELCLPANPRRRCSLTRLSHAIATLKSRLAADQLGQTLGVFLPITETESAG
ncbi:hypothetical protein O3P69_016789 [Scylla paramamosain]|uniref:Protein kinase domain-containing protein n=1 Tax=Scylla paramamosain TaxID=85552 RepID=A0AAW0SZ59_SCYPA